MKMRVLVSVLMVTLLLSNCLYSERVRGSGRSVTWEENYSGFSQLDFSNSIEAEVEYGDDYKIVLSIDDNLRDYVDINNQGEKLYLGLRDNVSYSKVNFKVHITMPKISSLDASGASEVQISGFKSKQDLTLDLSGATELEGFIHVGDLFLDVSGASEVEFIGSAENLKIEGSGASELDFSDFKVETAHIDLSGASEVVVNVRERLSVDCSGASEVKYYGDPRMGDINSSGASRIRRLD